jgi:hypothetical protein
VEAAAPTVEKLKDSYARFRSFAAERPSALLRQTPQKSLVQEWLRESDTPEVPPNGDDRKRPIADFALGCRIATLDENGALR